MLRAGTPQYLEYIVLWSTTVKFVLNPRLGTAALTTSPSFCVGSPDEPTMVTTFEPVYLPLGYPASFMYFLATAMFPDG
jgi:hypothetical protein